MKHTSPIYATQAFRIYVALLTVALATGAAGAAVAEARPWKPHIRDARQYAETRGGQVSFGVRTNRGLRGVGVRRAVPSASVVKAMLLVAYLRRPEVRRRPLRPGERALLGPMIRRSDNARASQVCNIVGTGGLARLAGRARMRNFRADAAVGAVVDRRGRSDALLPPHRPAACRAGTGATRCGCCERSSRRSGGGSRGSARAAGRSTSRAAGDRAPGGPTTRWRCSVAAGAASRWRS